MVKISRLAPLTLLAIFLLQSCKTSDTHVPDISPNATAPTEEMVNYQMMELVGFIHFTVNTFTDKEWGYGDEDPSIFNPTELDTDQWAKVASDAGMKQLILTAKHHDGFCLWPSKYTKHTVASSPYKNGKGDIVGELVKSCKKYGLKVGLYLSPWDRNHKDYGKEEYITYYRNQLTELLTEYGSINEIWFDGANGGDGYYGGANEERKIDRATYYDWDSTFNLVKSLQPNIKIFSDAGPDVHWIGNEHGFAGETFWSPIDKSKLVIGASEPAYLNQGEESGKDWIVGQCDVSIRPGWFYHANQDSLVKSPEQLADIYYKSVGRNGLLLLNLPPDKRGLINENDVQALQDFRKILDTTFKNNLAKGSKVSASNHRLNNPKFAPENVLSDEQNSYWATDDKTLPASLTIEFPAETALDRFLIQEPIQYGQRIGKFQLEAWVDGSWKPIFSGTTIGYKRIARFDRVTTSKLRLSIQESNNTVAISNIEAYNSEQEGS